MADAFNEGRAAGAEEGTTAVVEEWGLNSFYQPERGGFTKERCMKRLREQMAVIRGQSSSSTLMVTHKVTVFGITEEQVNSGGIVAFDSATNQSMTLEL